MAHFCRWVCRLSRVSGVASALLMLLSVIVVCQMVFVRAVLGQSSIWQTDFVTFSLIAATFLGAPYILLTRGHVSVDLLPLMASPLWRRRLTWIGSLGALGFCLLFFFSSVAWWWDAWAGNVTTPSIWRVRLWIPYLSVPVGMFLLCLQYVADLWALATDQALPYSAKPEIAL